MEDEEGEGDAPEYPPHVIAACHARERAAGGGGG